MPETLTERSAPMRGVIKERSRFSPVWIVPIIAALLGAWLVWKYYSARGPAITVRFENADGIVAGKTAVLCKNVNVGTVENVELTKDLKGVLVHMQMEREATRLLTQDAQ